MYLPTEIMFQFGPAQMQMGPGPDAPGPLWAGPNWAPGPIRQGQMVPGLNGPGPNGNMISEGRYAPTVKDRKAMKYLDDFGPNGIWG